MSCTFDMPKGPQTTRFRYRKSSLFGNSTPSLCELACSISAVIDSKLLGSKSAFVLVNLRTPRQFQAEVSISLDAHEGSGADIHLLPQVLRFLSAGVPQPRHIYRASAHSARWVFSGTMLELMTRQRRIRYLDFQVTVTTMNSFAGSSQAIKHGDLAPKTKQQTMQ
ncbi:uncharacterized protein TNCV_4398671 [Trichonephila clavipes]|nr:uncharacterized protein TNCV_4398671 [Trichonephila clavipes]